MKLSRLQRVLKLVTILQMENFSNPDELSNKLNVSRRTIFRDFDLLRKVGIPYYHDTDIGGYKIDSDYLMPPLNLNLMEALSLMISTQHINGACKWPFRKQSQDASLKLEAAMPSHIQHHCGIVLKDTSMKCAAHVQSMGQEYNFNVLQQAVQRRNKVKMIYESFAEKKLIATTLSPFHLHFDRRAWYVIGLSALHNEIRTFKLSRIQHLKTLTGKYIREKPFSIEKYLGQAWAMIPEGKIYHIKLCFSPMVAGNVAEVLWHKTQKLSRLKNGSLIFEADVDGIREITWWIMGYANQVEVLEPKPLRKRVAQLAKKTADIYNRP